VIAGGLLMMWKGWHWVDPLITVLISVYIIKETWHVLAETYQILMQSVPPGIALDKLRSAIMELDQIKNVHHIHVWSLTDQQIHFEAHLELCEDMKVSESQQLYHQVAHKLEEEFGIHHVTLQPEIGYCNDFSTVNSKEINE